MSARKIELDLIPVAEAADIIRKHHRTVRRYIVDGKLTGYRVGGWSLMVDRNEVNALIRPVAAAPRDDIRTRLRNGRIAVSSPAS